MKEFNAELAKDKLDQELAFYGISVKKWSVGANGRAWPKSREVKIPKPTDVEKFCVAMHEIKHIIDGIKGKLYQREYACEQYALYKASQMGFDASKYEKRAKGYITMNIAKGHCRGLDLDTIPEDIKDFCGVDFEQWKGRRVFVSNWASNLKISIS